MKKFKENMTFKAIVPFSQPSETTVYIGNIIHSFHKGRKLIIYRVLGRYDKKWHEFMCYEEDMEWYIERAKSID